MNQANAPKTGTVPFFFLLSVSALFALSLLTGVPGALAATKPVGSTPLVKLVPSKALVVAKNLPQKLAEAHLLIPRIKVDAIIKDMGLTSGGAMAIPGNRVDVGWFSLGTRPGEVGSAVVGGHNRWDDGTGVFIHLDQLKKGDLLSVVDAKGASTTFMVRDIRSFDALDEHSGIFSSESGVHLNLITCSGTWNPKTKSYTKRLVIFTDVVPPMKK